jgi:hypothetical protein
MSAAELLPAIQSLPWAEKIELYKALIEELRERDHEPRPDGFPPPEDHCPYTREQLEYMRREPGIYTLDEIWRSLGAK